MSLVRQKTLVQNTASPRYQVMRQPRPSWTLTLTVTLSAGLACSPYGAAPLPPPSTRTPAPAGQAPARGFSASAVNKAVLAGEYRIRPDGGGFAAVSPAADLRARWSASVVGRDEMVVWRLSRDAVEQLQREAPDVALRFHQGMAALLSRRLARTSRHVSILAS
jgi:hypothetical protein